MPCGLVGNAHISVLVNAADQYAMHDAVNPAGLGAMLSSANKAAYEHRYAHCLDRADRERLAEDFVLQAAREPLHPFAVVKAAEHYASLSKAQPDWKGGAAALFVADLIEEVEDMLSEDELTVVNGSDGRVFYYRTLPEFHRLPWRYEDLTDAYELG